MAEELSILFPGEDVELEDGKIVTVRPLPLSDLPKVMTAFCEIMRMADKGAAPAEIALTGFAELLKILPYCVDRPTEEIQAVYVPDILDVVLKQNVTAASVAKWKTLIQRVSEQFPMMGKVPADQSIHSKK